MNLDDELYNLAPNTEAEQALATISAFAKVIGNLYHSLVAEGIPEETVRVFMIEWVRTVALSGAKK